MEIRPECYLCLERLVELTVGLAAPESELKRQAIHAAREIIAREFTPGSIPALIANRFHRAIREITGNPDPFASRKAAETAYLDRMYAKIASSYGEDLESLLKLAVVGNAIDFFRDEAEVTQDILARVEFGISHLPGFLKELERGPGLVLYLADNAGEQFFDRPLVDYLRRQGRRVFYVVKGGPIQNDLTRQDLSISGLWEALEPVADTGACTVGLVLAAAGPHFRQLYDEAQIILAKGMGHFETMSHLGDPRVFFLLQAKCPPVARALGVPRRTFVFCQAS
ncbi:MAG: ARMT1-like domain-containing protein [Desulfobaccales bacterium]|nr:ARMT1-like domain-containing protein [Desulfobaccales bacterium]